MKKFSAKKVLSVLLSVLMVVSIIPMGIFSASAKLCYDIITETDEEAAEANNGYISFNDESAEEGETVTVNVHPNEGYRVEAISYEGENDTVEVKAIKGVFSFIMPAEPVTVTATFTQAKSVVLKTDDYFEALEEAKTCVGGDTIVIEDSACYWCNLILTGGYDDVWNDDPEDGDSSYTFEGDSYAVSVPYGYMFKNFVFNEDLWGFIATIQPEPLTSSITNASIYDDKTANNGYIEVAGEGKGFTTIEVTVCPNTGCYVKSVLAETEEGSRIIVTQKDSSTYTFVMPNEPVTVWGEFQEYDTFWFEAPRGTGDSEQTPYTIENTKQLEGLAYLVNVSGNNFLGKYIKLADDFDGSKAFKTPIGSGDFNKTFAGNFDGNDKTVNVDFDITCFANDGFERYFGFFTLLGKTGYTGEKYGSVKNLRVSGEINAQLDVLNNVLFGAITGNCYHAEIDNCSSSAKINVVSSNESSILYCGGIAGTSIGATIKNCSTSGDIYISNYTAAYLGGTVGYFRSESELTNCYSSCKLSGKKESKAQNFYIGGLTGLADNSTINNCYSVCSFNPLTTENNYIGGITGKALSSPTLNNCFTTYEDNLVGSGSTATIQNCGKIDSATKKVGEDMLIDVLNKYVDEKTGLKEWITAEGVNNGYPVLYDKYLIPFNITNNTKEADKETNHGYIKEFYITNSKNPVTTAKIGENVKILVEANEGYAFDQLVIYKTGDKNTVVANVKYNNTFIMPDFDVTVEAVFYDCHTLEPATGAFGDSITREINRLGELLCIPPQGFESFLVDWVSDSNNAQASMSKAFGFGDNYTIDSNLLEKYRFAMMVMFAEFELTTESVSDEKTVYDRVVGAYGSDTLFNNLSGLINCSQKPSFNKGIYAHNFNVMTESVFEEVLKYLGLDCSDLSSEFFYAYLNNAYTNKPQDTETDSVARLKKLVIGHLADSSFTDFTQAELDAAFIRALKDIKECGNSSLVSDYIFTCFENDIDNNEKRAFEVELAILARIDYINALYNTEFFESIYGEKVTEATVVAALLSGDVFNKSQQNLYKALQKKVVSIGITNGMTVTQNEYSEIKRVFANNFVNGEEGLLILQAFSYDCTNGTAQANAQANNGYITLAEKAFEGEEVTITATPISADYELKSFKVTYNDGSEKTVEVDADGKFIMPAYAVTVTAVFSKLDTVIFAEYKEKMLKKLDGVDAQYKALVEEAILSLSDLTFDSENSLQENLDAIDSIYNTAISAVNVEKEKSSSNSSEWLTIILKIVKGFALLIYYLYPLFLKW